jgi:hypothetical protein
MDMNRSLSLIAVSLSAACYSYAPVAAGSLAPGSGVRARVSASAAERIAPLLGAENPRVLSGKLVDNAGGTLIIEVPTVVQAGVAGSAQSLYQRVSIAPTDILELESRRLDRSKTALVAVGGAVAAGLIIAPILKSSPGSEHAPGGSTSESKIPIFRFSF